MSLVRVQVPATSANLGPGFDCLGIAWELFTTVELAPLAGGLFIEVSGEGVAEIPRDERNLVYQAARAVFRQVDQAPGGLRIRINNSIPVARGLGASAAAVVGGIVAANVLVGRQLSVRQLLALACQIEGHPDNVTAALLGGLVVAVVADGEVKYVRVTPPPGLKAVVAVPEQRLATRTAREVLPKQVNFQDAVFNVSRAALLVAALLQGELGLLGTAMEDRLHQCFRFNLMPGVKKVVAAARLAGARGVALSGAGPAVVAIADANFELIARVMRDTFRQNGIPTRVLILNPCPVGARALERK